MIKRIIKWLNNRSLIQKLVIYFLVLALSIITILSIYFYHYAREEIINRTFDRLTAIREIKKIQIEKLVQEKCLTFGMATGLLQEPLGGSDDLKKSFEEDFNKLMLLHPDLSAVFIAFRKPNADTLLIYGTETATASISDTLNNLYQRIQAIRKPLVTEFVRNQETDPKLVLLIAIPATRDSKNTDTGYSAVVFFEVQADKITGNTLYFTGDRGFGNTGEAYLVGGDYRIRSISRFVPDAPLRISNFSDAAHLALAGESGKVVTTDYRNMRVYSSYAPVKMPGLTWAILSEIDYDEVMGPVHNMRNDILFLTLVISAFVLAIAIFLAYGLVDPLRKLEAATGRLGKGDLEARVPEYSGDELGKLSQSFNQMASQLQMQNQKLLEEKNKRLSALYDGQEQERRRIARELHDGLGQLLAGIRMNLQHYSIQTPETSEKINQHLTQAMEELHRISNNLHPPVIAESGLRTALRYLCDDTSASTPLKCEFSVNGDPEHVNTATAGHIYRICQEAVSNAARHSGADLFQLQLIIKPHQYVVIAEDNGNGFSFPVGFQRTGNGLRNIEERVALLGGRFSLESSPGNGTTLRVIIPA